MTEQPTTPPEPIQQSAFPTGRGVCWSAHPNIDGVVPPTQPYQPPARTRPAGWAKTGSVGASATLGSDEEPVTVPARPYGGWDRPLVSEEVYVPCRFDDETCVGQVTADRLCDVHRLGPSAPSLGVAGSSLGAVELTDRAETFESGGEIESPATFMQPYVDELLRRIPPGGRIEFETISDPVTSDRVRATIIPPGPAELLAMADDLNAHGGVDETFVAALLREAADPYADAKRGLGIVDPPPVKTTEPITYETIVEALEKIAPLGPQRLDVVKLTQEQIDAVTASQPHVAPSAEPWHFFGTPVELVETVEESTPYRLANAQPGGIVEIHGELTDAEFETLRADWPLLPRWIVEADHEFVAHVNDGVDKAAVLEVVQAAARRPAKHQHIWSATSPVRCVECRRYLRPWWRRTLDRVRRRFR